MIAATYAIPDVIVFVIASLLMLVGAVFVITMKNPVHSALSLIMTFFGVAIAFIELDAHFLAAVEVIVYAGAIVVLFLFVIMFLGVDRDDVDANTPEPLVAQRPLAALGVVITVVGIITMLAHSHWVTGATAAATNGVPTEGGNNNINALGSAVFTTYLYAFEITAALLIIAVVGAVVLARKERALDLVAEDA